MPFYTVEPEVAGELGPGTVFDHTTVPVTVERLEYQFVNWLGDAIVESTPCFIVTAELAQAITDAELTGAELGELQVSLTPEAGDLIDQPLPEWKWLLVSGTAGRDDFGINEGLVLVVSERVLELLREHGLEHADVEDVVAADPCS